MTVIIPAHIARAINESEERLRRAFEELPDEKKAEVVAEVERQLEEELHGSGGPCVGLCGRELR